MNLNYAKGSKVIITVFGKHKAGNVIERAISKKGVAHTIQTEDGKIYESIFVNGTDSVYINTSLTLAFTKSIEDGNNEAEVQTDTE
jgi:hypothetical protein